MCTLFVHEGCWLAMCERWWLHRDRLSTCSYEEVSWWVAFKSSTLGLCDSLKRGCTSLDPRPYLCPVEMSETHARDVLPPLCWTVEPSKETSGASPLVGKKHSLGLLWGWWLLEIYTVAHTDTIFSHLYSHLYLLSQCHHRQTANACLLKMCSNTVRECGIM